MNPAVYNPKVYRNIDFTKSFTWKDGSCNAINLSGSTLTAFAFNKEETKKYADITCSITNASAGQFTISMTETQTKILPDIAHFSVKRLVGTNSELLIKGELYVEAGYQP